MFLFALYIKNYDHEKNESNKIKSKKSGRGEGKHILSKTKN
jgi:hypothetical protein